MWGSKMSKPYYRLEIIANQSVHEEIRESLEDGATPFNYTYLPAVQGAALAATGRLEKKLGDDTWPELNSMYIVYTDGEGLEALRKIILSIKEKFPREGIKLFIVPALMEDY